MSLFDMKKIFGVLLAVCIWGCSEDSSDPDFILPPDGSRYFALNPNDKAPNDSASANLARGIRLHVHPKGSYELSFKRGNTNEPPVLQLFRMNGTQWSGDSAFFTYNRVRNLEADLVGDRYVYKFNCEEERDTIWVTSLSLDGDYYNGSTDSVRFTGVGTFSDHFSLNLIVTGEVGNTTDGLNPEELATRILAEFRKYFTSVEVDTIYVRYAKDHPEYGKKFPADEPWLAGRSSEDLFVTELGGWPEDGVREALDIVYVHRIEVEGILGYSKLFSGNLGGGFGSTLVVGNKVLKPDDPAGEYGLSSEEIAQTIVHETGHYFGLRHTTATSEDIANDYDFSNAEDGLEDTPFCKLLSQDEFGKFRSVGAALKSGKDLMLTYTETLSCKDASNYMFPLSLNQSYTGFSKQQLEIIRDNLMLFPH